MKPSSMYAKGTYNITQLESITRDEWMSKPMKERSDIRLALNQSIPYAKGAEKTRLMDLRSRLIDFAMGVR